MRWIQDPKTNKLISHEEYAEKYADRGSRAKPIYGITFGDRQYENTRLQDGTIINSRKQHRQYMKDKNLTTIDDFSGKGGAWEKQNAAKGQPDKTIKRDLIENAKKHGYL